MGIFNSNIIMNIDINELYHRLFLYISCVLNIMIFLQKKEQSLICSKMVKQYLVDIALGLMQIH